MKKHTRKQLCPVSKKFYSTITSRVRESLRLVGREDAAEETMGCIYRYMTDGSLPPSSSDTTIILVFNLLRMEIDKALQRSRRARQRAADNKAAVDRQFTELAAILATSATENQLGTVTESHEEDEEPASFVPRNRRERRLYEQELRRIARRQSRKKGFAYSGDF